MMRNDPPRVLLIEDNPRDARLIRELLSDTFEPPTSSGSDRSSQIQHPPICTHKVRLTTGLDTLANGDYDVVLLDLNLPDSRGIDTVVTTRLRAPLTPIIVLTGMTDPEIGIEALQHGAEEFLVKGEITTSLLGRTVYHAIERSHAKRPATQHRNPSPVLNRLPLVRRDNIRSFNVSYLRDTLKSIVPNFKQIGATKFSSENTASRSNSDDRAPTSTVRDTNPSEWPLTPEELILEELSCNGGVMRQQQIAKGLNWTHSKTSRKLSDMEEAGIISRYQIGREKAVFLPGNEPEFLRRRQ